MSQFDTSLMFRYDTGAQKVTEKAATFVLQAFLVLYAHKLSPKLRKEPRLF